MRNITHLVVHCSASPPKLDVGVKEIRKWHLARGFLDIGYHYVIRRSGKLEKGRPDSEPGAHVEGHNATTIGICMVGGVKDSDGKTPEANFDPDQLHTLHNLLVELKHSYPAALILGHRDFPNVHKACPSFDVHHWTETGEIKE